MKKRFYIFFLLAFLSPSLVFAANPEAGGLEVAQGELLEALEAASGLEVVENTEEGGLDIAGEGGQDGADEIDVANVIFSHIGDSYYWHIADIGDKHISLYLPVILFSKNSGMNVFSSSKIAHGKYRGFSIGGPGSGYEGKIVEISGGEVYRPWDFSITKNVLALMFSVVLLMLIVLLTARWYKKHDVLKEAPSGIAAFMEPVIMMIHEISKENIGEEDYKRYSPFLIMAFLFIFLNNILGIVPILPGGANLTGNIAVTLSLAGFTFLIVNLTGNKHYFKELFAPDVPVFLKPIMPVIEVFSAIMKPVSLTIRLFANMLAGHIQILSIVCIIFILAKLGPVLFGTMSVVSVAFGIFLDFLEILVSFIQAYVFTMLSSIYIGLARQKH